MPGPGEKVTVDRAVLSVKRYEGSKVFRFHEEMEHRDPIYDFFGTGRGEPWVHMFDNVFIVQLEGKPLLYKGELWERPWDWYLEAEDEELEEYFKDYEPGGEAIVISIYYDRYRRRPVLAIRRETEDGKVLARVTFDARLLARVLRDDDVNLARLLADVLGMDEDSAWEVVYKLKEMYDWIYEIAGSVSSYTYMLSQAFKKLREKKREKAEAVEA